MLILMNSNVKYNSYKVYPIPVTSILMKWKAMDLKFIYSKVYKEMELITLTSKKHLMKVGNINTK